jgi:hypothetical protein
MWLTSTGCGRRCLLFSVQASDLVSGFVHGEDVPTKAGGGKRRRGAKTRPPSVSSHSGYADVSVYPSEQPALQHGNSSLGHATHTLDPDVVGGWMEGRRPSQRRGKLGGGKGREKKRRREREKKNSLGNTHRPHVHVQAHAIPCHPHPSIQSPSDGAPCTPVDPVRPLGAHQHAAVHIY